MDILNEKTTNINLSDEDVTSVFKEYQPKLFETQIIKVEETFSDIEYQHRGYNVNDKTEQIIDSKIQAMGFFSGAGGLDIGTQLAGIKIISSLDFDRDSVETMRANKYFAHAKHFHKDIKDVSGDDYKNIIKENNPEKLIFVGGPPCQPFSKAGYWVTNEKRKANDDPRNMIGNYLKSLFNCMEKLRYQLFPRSFGINQRVRDVIFCLEKNFSLINSYQNKLSSNEVLEIVRQDLERVDFTIEKSKSKEDKIRVPVLFGLNNKIDKFFDADGISGDETIVLEVEAGRPL